MDGAGGRVIAEAVWNLPSDVEITDPRTARARFEFVGASWYLADALTEDRILDIARGAPAPRLPEPLDHLLPGQRRAWEEDKWYREQVAAHGVHRKDGQPGIPARHLLRCLIEAGAWEPYEGRTKLTDNTGSRVPGLIRIEEDFLSFPNDDWELDLRAGMRRKRKVTIARALFPRWGFTATIAFDPHRFSAERLRHLAWVAGYRVGLGSFRKDPRSGHIRAVFGRFRIQRWDVLTADAPAEAA